MNNIFTLMQPELGLILILVILLCMKISDAIEGAEAQLNIVNTLLFLYFITGFFFTDEGSIFGGMYVSSPIISFEKSILTLGTLLVSFQSRQWLTMHKHLLEFYMLLFSTLMGMFYMISSGNILMFYLGLELSTIPLAALVNFDLEKQRSSEGAMKLILSSAFSSGILLYGISMLYGSTGTLDFAALPDHLTGSSLQIMAFVFIFAGFAFKISVVPFHLWTADVYEGAPIAVTAYLSVVSKGAIVFAFLSAMYKVFYPFADIWLKILFLTSVLSMTVGNLFALRQNNLKRFLAFSTITQAGYILLGIAGTSRAGASSVIYFILVYIFSNLGAFAVISLVSAISGKEEIDDYKGFYKTNPVLSWILTLSLFSLAGIPPTAGFFGKIFLITSGAANGNYLIITIAALNMVISLYYYLKIVRAIFVDKNENPISKIEIPLLAGIGMLLCIAGILFGGLSGSIYEFIFNISSGI